jgi:hypothetical protein
MLETLFKLLLHMKSGAISGVFLLGATGALVSVSATKDNGVTNITFTEASASPSASVSPRPSASPTPTRSASPSPSASPATNTQPSSSSPSTSACTDEAKALAFQLQRVDSAFNGFHTDLMKLRAERDRATVEKADAMLRSIRQAAAKSIHATATVACFKKHDEDDEDEDADEAGDHDGDHQNGEHKNTTLPAAPVASALSILVERNTQKDNDGKDKAKAIGITFSGDAKAIADQAIAAMQVAFDTAKNAPAKTPKPSPTVKADAKKVFPTKAPEHKGEHRD